MEAVRWLFEKLGRLFIHGAWGAELGTNGWHGFFWRHGLVGPWALFGMPTHRGVSF